MFAQVTAKKVGCFFRRQSVL